MNKSEDTNNKLSEYKDIDTDDEIITKDEIIIDEYETMDEMFEKQNKRKRYYRKLLKKKDSFTIIERGIQDEIENEKNKIYSNLYIELRYVPFMLKQDMLDAEGFIRFYYDFLVHVFFENINASDHQYRVLSIYKLFII